MVLQAHRISMGEAVEEQFVLNLQRGATVLHVHHYDLPHRYVELVEMHAEDEHDIQPRRFVAVDTFCCTQMPLPADRVRFISALSYDNHVWNFFEVLD